MLVATGIFDNERFIPDNPISIPQKKKVIITIEDIPEKSIKMETSIANRWKEIGEEILNCDEELIDNPKPIQFRTIDEMEAL